ncbi:DUF2612 domain-containing protein [Sporosarcina sp. P17b]|uniref:DUF2612 domain-containing protein n=1 Tax=Sporosarcina sp. P17b TaxID=2048260 RepID=UPI000C169D38|nr:DUF2612 domain-containing protein [Sporosarcina sp. P17b]PIC73350.1 hypothetical protein CSV76_11070 [Sporosarcina sp. P17b]
MFNTQDIVSKLVDYFDKRPDSNISKLLGVLSNEVQEIKEANETVMLWRNIDDAEGATLDNIGSDVRIFRGSATDELYRLLIKAKIIRNLSDGTMDGIIRAIAMALSAQLDEVKIVEKWHDPFEPESLTIKAINMPLSRVIEAGMSDEEFVRVVRHIIAAGIKIEEILLQGTFELGDENEDLYDPMRGFSDTNNPETGGYLGSIYRRPKGGGSV